MSRGNNHTYPLVAFDARPGFTLIEILVVMGVVSVIAGLIVPAVQSAREAARRMKCMANLRQIGCGLHGYADSHGCLPPGRIKTYDVRYSGTNPPCTSTIVDKSIHVFIMPYMDQYALYNSVNQNLTIVGAENHTIHAVVVASYACPSDPAAGFARPLEAGALARYGVSDMPAVTSEMVFTSYAGCTGSFQVLAFPMKESRCRIPPQAVAQSNGCFHDIQPISLASVRDGLSNTILMAEKSTWIFEASSSSDPSLRTRHGWYVTGNWGDTLFTNFYPPNAFAKVTATATQARVNAASSLHQGGVNVLMGDGAVHFVLDSVQSWLIDSRTGNPVGAIQDALSFWKNTPPPGIWQALSTRDSGEAVSVDAF